VLLVLFSSLARFFDNVLQLLFSRLFSSLLNNKKLIISMLQLIHNWRRRSFLTVFIECSYLVDYDVLYFQNDDNDSSTSIDWHNVFNTYLHAVINDCCCCCQSIIHQFITNNRCWSTSNTIVYTTNTTANKAWRKLVNCLFIMIAEIYSVPNNKGIDKYW
jgi:hypothetical protein